MPKKHEVSAVPTTGSALAKTREEHLAALRTEGGAASTSSLNLPSLKLEHNIIQGEKNPDAGMFTLSKRDGLGNWNKIILGEEITMHFLFQRYILSFVDNDVNYGSPEFDNANEIVRLWKSTGAGDSRKSELFGEATPNELAKKFMITKNNRTYSQLKLLVVLYGYLDPEGKRELVKWSTNVSGTVGYQKFARKTTPFAVITNITRVEATSGSNKYYQPKFKVVSEVPDFATVLKEQQALKSSLGVGHNAIDSAIEIMGGEIEE